MPTGFGPQRRGRVSRLVGRALATLCIALIRLYQVTLGLFLGGNCRFRPTCSEYAIGCFRAHGPVRAAWLTTRRLLRCHPFGGGGFDPVPERV